MIRKSPDGVTFVYRPDGTPVQGVYLVGEFNDWSARANPMKRNADGAFETTVPLKPGVYQFRYVADGRWVNDDQPDGEVPNGFGSLNCIVRVKDAPRSTAPAPAAKKSRNT